MRTAEKRAKEICTAIGQRVRSIRKEKRLTLDDLAERTGFAKSYLSQIETLKREPPISTLTKIAFVLGVDVFFLISGEAGRGEDQSITIVRASERKVIPKPSGSPAYAYQPVNDRKTDRIMDGYVVTVGPDFPPEPLVHDGQELGYVLEGVQEFFYDGKKYTFKAGDSYYFESGKPHYTRAVGKKPAKVLVVFASKR